MPYFNTFYRYLFLWFLLIFFLNLPAKGTDNYDVFQSISEIEKQVYNKEYKQENFYLRLDRLEKSIFNTIYKDSIYDRLKRIQEILSLSKSLKINNERQNILDLLENRYFGAIYREETIDKRLSRLEEIMFGRIYIGNIDYRFKNLIKQIPASNQQTIFNMQSKNISESTYFSDVKKTKAKEITENIEFPIKVYIFPISEALVSNAQKAVQIWSEYIQITVTDQINDADIVISWKKHFTNIIKQEKTENGKSQYFIYSGKYKDTDFLNKFLVHQLGHSLGIWGHSNSKKDIMYPFKEFKNDLNFREFNDQYTDTSVEDSPARPSDRDVNTLIKIYGKDY